AGHPRHLTMTRPTIAVAALVAMSVPFLHSQAPAAQHKFTEIAPGVYSALAPASPNGGSNSAPIPNPDDPARVEAHNTPETRRQWLKDIRPTTKKPVRFLIDTYFHYDHTDGNQAFTPAIDIIGHEYTRNRLSDAKYMATGMLGNILASANPLAASLKDLTP